MEQISPPPPPPPLRPRPPSLAAAHVAEYSNSKKPTFPPVSALLHRVNKWFLTGLWERRGSVRDMICRAGVEWTPPVGLMGERPTLLVCAAIFTPILVELLVVIWSIVPPWNRLSTLTFTCNRSFGPELR